MALFNFFKNKKVANVAPSPQTLESIPVVDNPNQDADSESATPSQSTSAPLTVT